MKKLLIAVALLLVSAATASAMENCDTYPEKLTTCQQFTCQYQHPFTGTTETREIVGKKNGLCYTKDSLPNNGQQICRLPQAYLAPMAKQVEAVFGGFENSKASFSTSGDNRLVIDDVEIEDVMNKAIQEDICIIVGY